MQTKHQIGQDNQGCTVTKRHGADSQMTRMNIVVVCFRPMLQCGGCGGHAIRSADLRKAKPRQPQSIGGPLTKRNTTVQGTNDG